ncbi:Collagen alpha-6(VI) chain [Bulinus truncatus]|nr:Collagen alpha-6(VI) chain [Bulinus truncatus]
MASLSCDCVHCVVSSEYRQYCRFQIANTEALQFINKEMPHTKGPWENEAREAEMLWVKLCLLAKCRPYAHTILTRRKMKSLIIYLNKRSVMLSVLKCLILLTLSSAALVQASQVERDVLAFIALISDPRPKHVLQDLFNLDTTCLGRRDGRYPASIPKCMTGVYYRCIGGFRYNRYCPTVKVTGHGNHMSTVQLVYNPLRGRCQRFSPTCPTYHRKPNNNKPIKNESHTHIESTKKPKTGKHPELFHKPKEHHKTDKHPTLYHKPGKHPKIDKHPILFHKPGSSKVKCYSQTADILYILDSSGSISYHEWKKELEFVNSMNQAFTISSSNVQVSVTAFGSRVYRAIGFTSYNDNPVGLNKAIHRLRKTNGGTNTAAALIDARDYSFSIDNGARPDVAKFAILVTDGDSDNPHDTLRAAKRLKKAGVVTIAVGAGPGINYRELINIASSPNYVFTVSDFSSLKKVRNNIARIICQSG